MRASAFFFRMKAVFRLAQACSLQRLKYSTYTFHGHTSELGPNCYVAPNAAVIGIFDALLPVETSWSSLYVALGIEVASIFACLFRCVHLSSRVFSWPLGLFGHPYLHFLPTPKSATFQIPQLALPFLQQVEQFYHSRGGGYTLL